ncbi:RNase H family protein [Lactobacillus terrae]|uniref:RNase H family protein n=1 Tax=Lactobacillus terrae TaxID=2269374 RepID=UPI000C1B6591|nr:RNase H family protein [Lactobacillus terrae]
MIKLYTDAGINTNQNIAAISYYIDDNENQYEHSENVKSESNHYLEFLALKKALEYLKDKHSNDILLIFTDSKILYDSINKNYAKSFQNILDEIMALLKDYPDYFIKEIRDKQNNHAHMLVHKQIYSKYK